MKITCTAIACALGLGCASPAFAEVSYSFSGNHGNVSEITGSPAVFEIVLPDFITSDLVLTPSEMVNCQVPASLCLGASFYVDSRIRNPWVAESKQTIALQSKPSSSVTSTTYYYFQQGAFTTPGTYQSVDTHKGPGGFYSPATLTVTLVPEPHSFLLMLVGLGALALLRKTS